MGRIFVIGVGPGSKEFLTPAASNAVKSSDVLVGGKEVLKRFKGREKIVVGRDIEGVMAYIRENRDKRIGVLTSGDPCFYSLLGRILKEFPKDEVEIVPGISSLQLFFARIKETLNDATLFSLHGRGLDGLLEVAQAKKLVLLTDSRTPPNKAAEHLLSFGSGGKAFVGENLGGKEERITEGSLADISRGRFSGNAVMAVMNNQEKKKQAYVAPGIPDESFEKGGAPMTKEEVRAVALAKALLRENSVVYDIGAGTGSISIEAALLAWKGRVFAVEKQEWRAELVKRNTLKFGLRNVELIQGEAPEALEKLPAADRIIIGGSGGRLAEILHKCDEKLVRGGRLVMNFVSLDSLSTALSALEEMGYEYEVTQLVVNKGEKLGGGIAVVPKTAVFIVSARRTLHET